MPSPLVAREHEITTLRQALSASEVDGRSIVIGGDAGSGKTAVLTAFRADLRGAGVTVVEGACVEIESRRPFGAFADVVVSCERAFGTDRVARSMGERGVHVRQLTSPSTRNGRVGDRYQMHGAILGLITDLATDGPLAVLIEDLHWADAASLELFGYLARRLRTRPVLLVATYRSDELDRRHPLRPALAELQRGRLLDEIALGPLDVDGTEALIVARLALRDPAQRDLREFREMIHARCEGNPLHTEETLDTLRQSRRLCYAESAWTCDVLSIRDAIPASVADGVIARWGRLSPATQQILLVASVIGHRFDLDLLSGASGASIVVLEPLIHEAIDAQLVREEMKDQSFFFRHALTREALRQQLLQSERAALHAKIAALLEHRRETAVVSAAELAYHVEESGDPARSSAHHEAAAAEAAASMDYGSAARSMERSIATAVVDDERQGRRYLALVRYLRLGGDEPRAARAAAAALAIGERTGDARVQCQALLDRWRDTNSFSDEVGQLQMLDRALALLGPLGPTPELARVYSAKASAAARLGDVDAAVSLAERARETAAALGLPGERATATVSVAVGLYRRGQLEESVAACREAVDIAERAGLVEELYGALMALRPRLVAIGAPADEQRAVQLKLRALWKAHGLGSQEWIVRELIFLHGEGDWDGFLRLLPQLADTDHSDFDVPRIMARFIAVARTGPDEIADWDVAGLRAAYSQSAPAAFWSVSLLLLAGRATEAVELAASIRDEDVWRRYWGLMPASLIHSVGLFAARACDDHVARERFVGSLLTERPLPAMPNFNRRHGALARADVAERAGRIDDALLADTEALADCERSTYAESFNTFVMLLIRQHRAELHLRAVSPDVGAAQGELDALLPYWQRAKATWYVGQLRIWAERLGLTFPSAETTHGTKAVASPRLTRRELEVARLVAQGLTNREIATRLTLSVRTAESHVERIRSKLGFRARAQIASWVTERYGPTRPS